MFNWNPFHTPTQSTDVAMNEDAAALGAKAAKVVIVNGHEFTIGDPASLAKFHSLQAQLTQLPPDSTIQVDGQEYAAGTAESKAALNKAQYLIDGVAAKRAAYSAENAYPTAEQKAALSNQFAARNAISKNVAAKG